MKKLLFVMVLSGCSQTLPTVETVKYVCECEYGAPIEYEFFEDETETINDARVNCEDAGCLFYESPE